MTARPAAAESFLALLDDLAGAKAKPSGAAAAVMLAHAATHLRGLLDQVRELEREAEDEAALDEVLAAVRSEIRGQAAASPGGKSRPRNPAWPFTTDAPRPDGPSPVAGSGPGHRDLSHLPPMAGAGQDMCRAESAPHPGFRDRWDCTARRGHPERWHAAHDEETGEPHAALFPDAAWPVAARETGLPNQAFEAALECGAADGSRWACNAVQGHAPLDHVAFADDARRRAVGAVLARWASVHPGAAGLARVPLISGETLAEIAKISREWPDGIHTCAELQKLEPGRRPCTCGRCEPAAKPGDAFAWHVLSNCPDEATCPIHGAPDKCPDHDASMPHDVRYQGWRSCPPDCPYRLWHERHGLTEPPQSNGHALRPPGCAGCGHPWIMHGLNARGGPCYGNESACQCAEYEPPGDDARRAGRDSQGKNGGERARLAGRDLSVSPPSPAQDVRRDGMGAQGEPATGTTPPGANTVPPRIGMAVPGAFIEAVGDLGEITEAEHDEAVAWLEAKYGHVPPSLQSIIDKGGRIKRIATDPDKYGFRVRAPYPAPASPQMLPPGDAPWPGAEEIRRLSAVADDGAPAGIGKPCTCLPGVCRGGGCEACAGLDECYLQQEVTTP